MIRNKTLVRLLLVLNLIVILLLIASSFARFANPVQWWPVAITGLAFPVLLFLTLLTGIAWLFYKPKYAIVHVLAIIASIPNIFVLFPVNGTSQLPFKDPAQLRLISWNVNLMNYSAANTAAAFAQNNKIFQKIYDLNADVVCLQEFFTAVITMPRYNFIDSFSKHFGYKYYYFSRDLPKFDGKFYSGTIILSRYPIVDSIKYNFPGNSFASVIKTGIAFRGDTIDVVSTHLQNINFGRDQNRTIGGNSITTKLKYGYADQLVQVKALRQIFTRAQHPVIFAGDLNDVPLSFVYNSVKGEMKDAWLEKGSGIGGTYRSMLNLLRIDYIFHDASIKNMYTDRITSDASDHNGLVTDLQLP